MNGRTLNWMYGLGAAFVLTSFPLAGFGMFAMLNGAAGLQNMPYYVVSWTVIGLLCLVVSIDKLKFFMAENKR